MLMLYNISMRTMVRQVKMHERSEDIMFKRILSAVLAASMITLPGAVTHAENEVVVDPDTVLRYDNIYNNRIYSQKCDRCMAY